MSIKVNQNKVDDLLNEMETKVPGSKILYKDEPLPFWIRLLFIFPTLIGFFYRPFRKKWNEQIANQLGRYIILPSRKDHADLTDLGTYILLRHEFQHLLDWNQHKILFGLTYILFPLPVLLSGRAHWELRAYVQNMIVRHEEGIPISETYLEWIVSQFTGPLYFWMFPFKKKIMKKLKSTHEGIIEGSVKGYSPNITLW